jgi:hypothetical protein
MSNNTNTASTVWPTDGQFYLQRGEWVRASNASTSSTSQDTQQQQQQQPFSQQYSDAGQRLGSDPSADLAAYFAAQPQTSSAPYQQQQQLVFGQPLFPPGPSQFVLDDVFRAAAEKNPMLRGFMQSVDQMAERNGIAGQQEQVKEQT